MSELNGLALQIYRDGVAKGWHAADTQTDGDKSSVEQMAVFTANLHSEASELWEAFREGRLDEPCDKALEMQLAHIPVMTCLEEELADILIRALDTAHTYGVDIDWAIARKMAFNKTRPHRHGGKLA